MTLAFAAAIGLLVGFGTWLMLRRSLVTVAIGSSVVAFGTILFLMAAGILRGRAPIEPFPPASMVSDPLVQALALTALVINFAITTVLLVLLYRIHKSHGTVDQEDIQQAESEAAEHLHRDWSE